MPGAQLSRVRQQTPMPRPTPGSRRVNVTEQFNYIGFEWELILQHNIPNLNLKGGMVRLTRSLMLIVISCDQNHWESLVTWPLVSVTSMMMQSFGPGPLRPSGSSDPEGTGVPPLVLELGELERLRRVGVGQGVRLGLRRRVRIVRVTTPFFNCCQNNKCEV